MIMLWRRLLSACTQQQFFKPKSLLFTWKTCSWTVQNNAQNALKVAILRYKIKIPPLPTPHPLGASIASIFFVILGHAGTHNFLLTFHSNHLPISYRFRDKRRFPSKIAWKSPIFPPPVYLTPRWRGSLEIGYRRKSQKKLEWWGYKMVEKVLR